MAEQRGNWKGKKFGKSSKEEQTNESEKEESDLTLEKAEAPSGTTQPIVEREQQQKETTPPVAPETENLKADKVETEKETETIVEPAEEPVKAPTEEPVETPSEEPVKVLTGELAETPTEEPPTEPAKELSEEITALPEQEEKIRLNKYLAKAGICSRREADKLITQGDVMVNGEVITELGVKVNLTDEVKYKEKVLTLEQLRYVLLNKPKDSVTTMEDTHDRRTVMDLVADACTERIYPVGRLDRMTTGLLLLTNDGELAKKLTHPSHEVKKVYLAELNREVSPADLALLTQGVTLEDGLSKFDTAEYDEKSKDLNVVIVSLHSGKNRIVRRMFAHLNYRVEKLDRISFSGLTKGNLTRGKWRFLTEKEIGFLKMR